MEIRVFIEEGHHLWGLFLGEYTLEICSAKKRIDAVGFHISFKAVCIPFIYSVKWITAQVCDSKASAQRINSSATLVAALKRME